MTLALAYAMLAASVVAPPDDLMVAVPPEAAVAVALHPTPPRVPGTDPGGTEVLGYLLRQAGQLGATAHLDTTAQVIADVMGSLPAVADLPVSVVLLEARAHTLPSGGHRLAGLRGAIIIRTDGRSANVTRRIQELIDLHTDQENTRIRKQGTGDQVFFTLTDARLPDWAVVQWGAVGPWYVVSIGDRSFHLVADAIRNPPRSLAADEWYAAARRRSNVHGAFLRVYVNVDRLRGQLGEVMTGVPDRVVSALGMGGLQRGLWTVGRRERFVEIACVLRRNGADRFVPVTVPGVDGATVRGIVPPGATSCAVLNVSGRDFILRCRDAWLASRSSATQARLRALWDQHVAAPDWSVHDDFLDRLGGRLVLHNHPRHPLGIPLLCTILIETDGSTEAVTDSIDRLLGALQHYLTPRRDDPSAPATAPWLRRAPDGVWYIQAGLLGPALAVTPRWIVISYAPAAVRQNVRFLKPGPVDRPATRPAKP